MPRHRFEYRTLSRTYRSLGMRDDKGREIGAIVRIQISTVVIDDRWEPDDERDRWRDTSADSHALGAKAVYLMVQPARNERGFGASQSDKLMGAVGSETNARVQIEVRRRIASMTKRYRKQFGGTP